jgi:hypothetical protein
MKNENRDHMGSAHYRLLKALADEEKRNCPKPDRIAVMDGNISLSAVVRTMDVPVALMVFSAPDGKMTYAAYGMEQLDNVADFAVACNALCTDQTVVVPDIRAHATLGGIVRDWNHDDSRFMVAIALRDAAGLKIGSLAVMDNMQSVAKKGISFRKLNALGQGLVMEGRPFPIVRFAA